MEQTEVKKEPIDQAGNVNNDICVVCRKSALKQQLSNQQGTISSSVTAGMVKGTSMSFILANPSNSCWED